MDFSEPMEQKESGVPCPSCGSINQKMFAGEVDIHFSGLGNVNKRPVVMHPVLLVCLNCGRTEFVISEEDLNPLRAE
jgi:hypothetical protein